MTRNIAPLRAHRLPLICYPVCLAMLDDPAARYPSISLSVPFPVSCGPDIAVTRMAHIFNARRRRCRVSDNFGCYRGSGSEQQNSVGETHGDDQGDAGEVHGCVPTTIRYERIVPL